MDHIEFEKESRLDVETALAQVRRNIQAECNILFIEATEFGEFGQLSVDVSLGENDGKTEWEYDGHPVKMIRCYFDCDLELYHEGTPEQISQYWATVAEKLTDFFFQKNPEYKSALQV